MARKRTPSTPPSTPKVWTVDEINHGVQKLQRRIAEAQALADDNVIYNDSRVNNVESNISSTVKDVFGENSDEYAEFRHAKILSGGFNRQPILQRGSVNQEKQRKFVADIPAMIFRLQNLVRRLEEKLLDAKHCPRCNKTYTDSNMSYCLDDGSPLVSSSYDPQADTLKFSPGE